LSSTVLSLFLDIMVPFPGGWFMRHVQPATRNNNAKAVVFA
jgi:hypothetical protein